LLTMGNPVSLFPIFHQPIRVFLGPQGQHTLMQSP
jgi:hypothetical protein